MQCAENIEFDFSVCIGKKARKDSLGLAFLDVEYGLKKDKTQDEKVKFKV